MDAIDWDFNFIAWSFVALAVVVAGSVGSRIATAIGNSIAIVAITIVNA